MGRAPAFWTDENLRMIQEQFVPVSISTSEQGRQDAVGQFCRDAGLDLMKWEVRRFCVTAGGKVLESGGMGFDLRGALAKWKALPESERAPGAVQVGKLVQIDAPRSGPLAPPGGLILKVYTRAFMRDGEGRLRILTGKDLCYDEEGKDTEETRKQRSSQGDTISQAHPDHLWLTEAEWKSLMPATPRIGDKFPMPAAIAERILRFHLNPLRIYGRFGPDALERKEVRAGELNLTVEAAGPEQVRLRLDGFARLGQDPPAAVAQGRIASLTLWGYEPRVLGYLEYDPRRRAFTRFDAVALGDHFGRFGSSTVSASRVGLQPLGISFELVQGDRPADLVPPGRIQRSEEYFELKK